MDSVQYQPTRGWDSAVIEPGPTHLTRLRGVSGRCGVQPKGGQKLLQRFFKGRTRIFSLFGLWSGNLFDAV